MKYRFGFIGCGNMGGALVTAVAKKIKGEEIAVCDHNADTTDRLADEFGVKTENAATVAGQSKFVILGVKPQVLQKAAEEFARDIPENAVIITMLAGVKTERIQNLFPTKKVIRIMPNLPCKAGQGVILYSASAEVEKIETEEFLSAFELAGETVEIAENKIDAASAISGCGPAFVAMFAEALADGGVRCGLTRAVAEKLASQTLIGSAALLKGGEHPEELKDAVCSPGGTTIEGVTALENKGFRYAVIEAVTKAYEKNFKL